MIYNIDSVLLNCIWMTIIWCVLLVTENDNGSDHLLAYILAPLGVLCVVTMAVISLMFYRRRRQGQKGNRHLEPFSRSHTNAGLDKQVTGMMHTNPFYQRYVLIVPTWTPQAMNRLWIITKPIYYCHNGIHVCARQVCLVYPFTVLHAFDVWKRVCGSGVYPVILLLLVTGDRYTRRHRTLTAGRSADSTWHWVTRWVKAHSDRSSRPHWRQRVFARFTPLPRSTRRVRALPAAPATPGPTR